MAGKFGERPSAGDLVAVLGQASRSLQTLLMDTTTLASYELSTQQRLRFAAVASIQSGVIRNTIDSMAADIKRKLCALRLPVSLPEQEHRPFRLSHLSPPHADVAASAASPPHAETTSVGPPPCSGPPTMFAQQDGAARAPHSFMAVDTLSRNPSSGFVLVPVAHSGPIGVPIPIPGANPPVWSTTSGDPAVSCYRLPPGHVLVPVGYVPPNLHILPPLPLADRRLESPTQAATHGFSSERIWVEEEQRVEWTPTADPVDPDAGSSADLPAPAALPAAESTCLLHHRGSEGALSSHNQHSESPILEPSRAAPVSQHSLSAAAPVPYTHGKKQLVRNPTPLPPPRSDAFTYTPTSTPATTNASATDASAAADLFPADLRSPHSLAFGLSPHAPAFVPRANSHVDAAKLAQDSSLAADAVFQPRSSSCSSPSSRGEADQSGIAPVIALEASEMIPAVSARVLSESCARLEEKPRNQPPPALVELTHVRDERPRSTSPRAFRDTPGNRSDIAIESGAAELAAPLSWDDFNRSTLLASLSNLPSSSFRSAGSAWPWAHLHPLNDAGAEIAADPLSVRV